MMTNSHFDPDDRDGSDQSGVRLALIVLGVLTPVVPLSAAMIGNPIWGLALFAVATGLAVIFCIATMPAFSK